MRLFYLILVPIAIPYSGGAVLVFIVVHYVLRRHWRGRVVVKTSESECAYTHKTNSDCRTRLLYFFTIINSKYDRGIRIGGGDTDSTLDDGCILVLRFSLGCWRKLTFP